MYIDQKCIIGKLHIPATIYKLFQADKCIIVLLMVNNLPLPQIEKKCDHVLKVH